MKQKYDWYVLVHLRTTQLGPYGPYSSEKVARYEHRFDDNKTVYKKIHKEIRNDNTHRKNSR